VTGANDVTLGKFVIILRTSFWNVCDLLIYVSVAQPKTGDTFVSMERRSDLLRINY
jgi:hypothetical protein